MRKVSLIALPVFLVIAAVAQKSSESLLALDDECDSEAQAGTSHCAVNALQFRVTRTSQGSQLQDTSNRSSVTSRYFADWWPISSTPKYDAKCYGNAGSESCNKESQPGGRCVCRDGCMGSDGNCHSQENKLIGTSFTLTNKKWSSYKMYFQRISLLGQLKTTTMSSSFNFGQDKFRLYELPGTWKGQKQYFLASDKWTDNVVAIQNTAGTALRLWGAYSVSLTKFHEPWNLRDVTLRVCSARSQGHPDAIMIGTSTTFGGSTIWTYLKSGTYFVFGYWYPERLVKAKLASNTSTSDLANIPKTPGDTGVWVPDPPFPRGVLPDC